MYLKYDQKSLSMIPWTCRVFVRFKCLFRQPFVEVVWIDHTFAGIILVDVFDRKAIGRPWMTVGTNVATRMVAGFHASFDAHSQQSVALCLTSAVAPKADLLTKIGTKAPWPVTLPPSSTQLERASGG